MTTHSSREHPTLYTVPEVAEILRLSVRTINAMVAEGLIRHVRIGKKSVRIEQSEIDRLIREGRTNDSGGH